MNQDQPLSIPQKCGRLGTIRIRAEMPNGRLYFNYFLNQAYEFYIPTVHPRYYATAPVD